MDSGEEPYSQSDPDNSDSGEELLSQGTSENAGNPLDVVYEALAVLSGYSQDWVNLPCIFACVKNVKADADADSVCMAIEQWVLLGIMMLDADSSKVKFLVQPFR